MGLTVAALCATHAVDARTHHRAPKSTAPAATKAANIPQEKNRDPADVALDRKIKGMPRVLIVAVARFSLPADLCAASRCPIAKILDVETGMLRITPWTMLFAARCCVF
jgi:hypothetical protein